MLLNAVYFAIVLGILVFVHELGHFIVARFADVKVLTFSLGFGKKLVRFRRGETEYAVSAVPLGGYVKMLGESTDDVISEEDRPRAYSNKPPLVRLAIAFSGPFFNVLFAALVFFVMLVTGYPGASTATKIGVVMKGDAADKAGIKSGDLVTSIDGQPISEWTQLQKIVKGSGGKELAFQVARDGKAVDIPVKPQYTNERNEFGEAVGKAYLIGVAPAKVTKRESIATAIPEAGFLTYHYTRLTILGIGKLIKGTISPKNVGGPILIFQQVGQQAKEGSGGFLLFLAIISINLGVVNLLPIPILDGGHILFSLIEVVVRRKIPDKTVAVAQKIGLGILICIMVLATYNDISRFNFFNHGK